MARSKVIVISGPIDAKHVGGVSVMSMMPQSSVDAYFNATPLQRSISPSAESHTSETPTRPSRKNSIWSFRRTSTSTSNDTTRSRSKTPQPGDLPSSSSRTSSPRPLKKYPSISLLRQKLTLEKDTHTPIPLSRSSSSTSPQTVPEAIQNALRIRRSLSSPSIPHHPPSPSPSAPQTQAAQPQLSTSIPKRKPSPLSSHMTLAASISPLPSPHITRPKRADSGTGIDFEKEDRRPCPMGFRQIAAVQEVKERLDLYRETREYWARVDHGLGEWVGRV